MRPAESPVRLLLVGGGHAHVHVLKAFGMRLPSNVQVTLVTRDLETPYSGMLPGLVARQYRRNEAHIDLAALARFAGVRLIQGEAVGLDRNARLLLCRDRPPLPYDILSLDIGAAPDIGTVPGAARYTIPVKPVETFLAKLDALEQRFAKRPEPSRLAVVGGGAAGVEIALALWARFGGVGACGPDITLLTRGKLLPSFPDTARRRLAKELDRRGIRVTEHVAVTEVTDDTVALTDGRRLSCDAAIWATGAAAPGWLKTTGLELDERGFLAVDSRLRSPTDPAVFATGDIATVLPYPREKAGVFAVRQGPPLERNLRRALAGQPPLSFVPQRRFLRLVGTGDGQAVAARGSLAAAGGWVWRWKDRIDRRWMQTYQDLPLMPPRHRREQTMRADQAAPMRCAGCGAKLPRAMLERVMTRLGIDPASGDDAAVLDLPPGSGAVLQTVDLFRAPVDDPWLFGRIAAVHALGDIHAMGARPLAALAIAALPHGPDSWQEEDLFQMLHGALQVLDAAGARLIGGHSAELGEIALGFAVTGVADGAPLLRKGGLRPGDRLILTKPLGTGVLLAGAMQGKAAARHLSGALTAMQQDNGAAARCLRKHGAAGCTDVTGFGLAGHLAEMLRASSCRAELELAALPVLNGALAALDAGVASTLAPSNQALACIEGTVADSSRHALLFDPQTAGGLLAGVPEEQTESCVEQLHSLGYGDAAVIGRVVRQGNSAADISIF
ncbi:selenide, water dikinase SelD [Indioceanicola profundi]|uniref:selenide, water dikinase SelD n=1 Tax=Indioceanicola profundi TaxID=2220096 RepID=UPI000E6ABD11|nr:selenide, water dikinase SelD [Indioceanicola profundi]